VISRAVKFYGIEVAKVNIEAIAANKFFEWALSLRKKMNDRGAGH
jgi:hypothetical protein